MTILQVLGREAEKHSTKVKEKSDVEREARIKGHLSAKRDQETSSTLVMFNFPVLSISLSGSPAIFRFHSLLEILANFSICWFEWVSVIYNNLTKTK